MKLGMVGLGRMGGNMARRLAREGHEVAVYDVDAQTRDAVAGEHPALEAADDLKQLVGTLPSPRIVWVMVPAGPATEQTVLELGELMSDGDIIINGGNCRWTDSIAYGVKVAERGVTHVDAGVSGGVWGLEKGFCLMVGGPEAALELARPIFTALAEEGGYARVGGSGAGHFCKMVHNGIEYALLQSFAEGFDLLHASEFDYDLGQVAELWRHGSVVRSWLLELAGMAFADEGNDLAAIAPFVEDSGEGRWTVEAAIDHAVPTPAIAASLFARFASRRDSFGDRLIAALRQQFGGHAVQRGETEPSKQA